MVKEFTTHVAGIYYSRGHVSGIANGDVLRLVREPNNPHDANAIRVEMADGTLLGRIPRMVALSLARDMDSGLQPYAVVQSTSPAHSGSAPRYGRNRQAAIKPSPPECRIIVRVGDGALTMPSTVAPHITIIRAPVVPTAPKPPPVTPSPQPAQPKSSCFVATAVFRDADHPTVAALRQWRDTSLARHRPGRLFIRGYALTGPRLARIVSAFPASRRWLAPLLAIIARVAVRPRRPSDP